MSTTTITVLIIAVVAIIGCAFLLMERQKSRRLKTRFGPEYERLVDQEGSPRRAEAMLDQREKRVEKFHIKSLTKEESVRFAEAWRSAQEHFVDDPRGAVGEADRLINEVLRARGYPMSDFDQQAADLSVEHPAVVSDYRTAHDIAVRDSKGQASTEDLRLAMKHYRNLFENVLDRHVIHQEVR